MVDVVNFTLPLKLIRSKKKVDKKARNCGPTGYPANEIGYPAGYQIYQISDTRIGLILGGTPFLHNISMVV